MSVGWASGKVILLGEHAVVYGRPAIAAALDAGARARLLAARGSRGRVRVCGPDGRILRTPALDRALAALLRTAGAGPGVDAEIQLELAPGGGLGSSAAMGLAVARALGLRGDDEAYAAAMAWERVFHGNPSGIDVMASLAGGCLRFQRGAPSRRIPLPQGLLLCVGHSGESRSTAAMVEHVARARAASPRQVERTFDRFAAAADRAEGALARDDLDVVGRLLDECQEGLASLELSTPAIDRMCEEARRAGALGAKLTGAGGGGAAIALVGESEVADRVLAAWRRAGLAAGLARVRGHGDVTPFDPAVATDAA